LAGLAGRTCFSPAIGPRPACRRPSRVRCVPEKRPRRLLPVVHPLDRLAMNDAADDIFAIEADIRRAAQALLRQQRDDGHWVFELEADATIPAEYILLRQYLGEPDDPELECKIGAYLRRIQAEHGGWPLFH